MRIFLTALVAHVSLAAAAPTETAAQSYFFGASAAASNPNCRDEVHGDDTGSGTQLQANATNHVRGNYVQFVDNAASSWVGFRVTLSTASTSTGRYLLYISKDGTNLWHPLIFVVPTDTGTTHFDIPLQLAANEDLYLAIQSSVGSSTVRATVTARIAVDGTCPPGFTTADALTTANTAATHASSTDITIANSNTGFGSISNNLSQSYGAFLITLGASTAPATAGLHQLRLVHGSGDTVIGGRPVYLTASSAAAARFSYLVTGAAAAGEALKVNIEGASATSIMQANVVGYR